jgi:hypothetical protein
VLLAARAVVSLVLAAVPARVRGRKGTG